MKCLGEGLEQTYYFSIYIIIFHYLDLGFGKVFL